MPVEAPPVPAPATPSSATAPRPPAVDGEDLAAIAETAEWRELARERRPIEVPLVYPVQFGSQTVESFVVKPTTARDMKFFSVDPRGRSYPPYLLAIGQMANQPPEVVEALAPVDVDRLCVVVNLFWRASRRTGAKR